MAETLEERIILSVDLDVSLLTQSAEEAIAAIKKIKDEQKNLETQGQQNTIQYRQNAQALSLYNKQLNDAAKALAINESQTKNNTGSLQDLRQQLIAAALQYKLYSEEQQKNNPVAIALSAQIKDLSTNIKAQELALGNASRNVGNYKEAIDPLKKEVIGLRQEHRDLTNVMQGALGVFALLNIAGGNSAKATELQKAALVGLVAVQAVSEIRLGAAAAAKVLDNIATGVATAATKTLAAAQAALNAVLLLNPYVAVAAAIAAIVVGMTLWHRKTEDTTDALIAQDQTIKDANVVLEELKLKYENLTGALTDAGLAIAEADKENEKAVKKIKDQTNANINASISKWDELKIAATAFFSPAAAAQLLVGTQGFKTAFALTNAQLEAQERVHQQTLTNIRTDAQIAADKKVADLAKKAAEAAAKELERQRLNRLEQDRVLTLALTEAEIAAWKNRNKSLDDIYAADVDNFSAAINKKAAAWTKSLGDELKAENDADKQKWKIRAQYTQEIGSLGDKLLDFINISNQNEIDALEEKHRSGLISEKAYNRQIAELRHKQAIAEREKAIFDIAIQTAVAVMQASPNPYLMALAAAIGFAEEAAVLSRPIPRVPAFAKGGVIGGKPHSQGGTKFIGEDGTQFEAEQGELIAVINKNSTAMLSAYSHLNQMGGGVGFFEKGGLAYLADGGFASRAVSQQVLNQMNIQDFANAVQQLSIIVRVSDINAVNGKLAQVTEGRSI